jgi:hypothetical protein
MEQRDLPPKQAKKAKKPKKTVKIKERDPLALWKQAWFCTINTNQNDPGLIRPLKIILDYIINHITSFIYGRGFFESVIETNRVIEQGSRFKRIHLHTKIEITSRGIAFLDFVKINNFINRNLRQIPTFKGVYFNARLIKNYNHISNIEAYNAKDPYIEESEKYPDFQIN